MFDDGEVLQGIDEDWNFAGANAIEWSSGLAVFMLISLFSVSIARAMPFMLMGWILTTTSLAALRKTFPDEQRGVRNAMMTACGFAPLDIPRPARLQPVWSGCPMREMAPSSNYVKYGFDEMFPVFQRDLVDADQEVNHAGEKTT